VAALALALGLTACGGGESQDANEPSGDFPVNAKASFPDHQQLVQNADLELNVDNVGDETIPNLAVTIHTTPSPTPAGEPKSDSAFDIRVDEPNLADPNRPVWILEYRYPKLIAPGDSRKDLNKTESAGAAAAQTDTFQFGALNSGDSRRIVWRVTPVRIGAYTVHYEVAAGLYGKARAVTAGGSPVKGEFEVRIKGKPPETCVKGAAQVTTQCRKA